MRADCANADLLLPPLRVPRSIPSVQILTCCCRPCLRAPRSIPRLSTVNHCGSTDRSLPQREKRWVWVHWEAQQVTVCGSTDRSLPQSLCWEKKVWAHGAHFYDDGVGPAATTVVSVGSTEVVADRICLKYAHKNVTRP